MNEAELAAPPRPQGWWAPKSDRAVLRELLKKRDAPGLAFISAWLAAVAGTTALLALAWGTGWLVPILVLHGAVLSFSYAASHECAHGTAFRTAWLNEVVFYLTSFVFVEEPMYRRYSHGRHHAYTWYAGYDSQMPYRNPMTLRRYLRETLALSDLWQSFVQTFRLGWGTLTAAEREFIPAARLRQMRLGARAFIAGYAALVGAAVVSGSAFVIVAFFAARAAGGWFVQLFINSQHMCMQEAVPDHRYSTRSLKCSQFTRLLYWNMNYHVEHHLYPGVPFHALPRVNRLIADQLPIPTAGTWRANYEILSVIRRQTTDPAHFARPSFAVR